LGGIRVEGWRGRGLGVSRDGGAERELAGLEVWLTRCGRSYRSTRGVLGD